MTRAAAFLLVAATAHAHVGQRDLAGYIGTDSLMTPAGKPKQVVLPASFLAVNPATSSVLVNNAALMTGGDDSNFAINLQAAGNVYVYGQQMTNCNVHVNGYITCAGNTELFDNHSLPDSRFAGNFLFAPFWDDLIPVAGDSTIVVEQQTGSFFAVVWSNFSLYRDPTARLTFRVVFQVQASPIQQGSVLFQYLSMVGASGGGADGSSATIGIQSNNGFAANLYSVNAVGAVMATVGAPGPLPSPSPSPMAATAVQAVLFDADSDGDRISDTIEASFNSNPALHDTDNDGQDDGVEVANGANPSASPAPGGLDATDIDGDTLTGAEEAFYGTSPNKADSDGDTTFQSDGITAKTSLKDNEEIYGLNGHPMTDPTQVDTDHDGFNDGDEIDAGTDPLNPASHPAFTSINLAVSSNAKYRPVAALDANGKIHIAATSHDGSPSGVYYYMIDPDGKVRIAETLFKLPEGVSATDGRHSAIGTLGGKVYIVYEVWDNGPPQLVFVRLDPAKAPQDGTPGNPPLLLEKSMVLPVPPGVIVARQVSMALSNGAMHLLMQSGVSTGSEIKKSGWFYAHYDLDGNLLSSAKLTTGGIGAGGGTGLDRKSRGAITVDTDGTVHLLIKNRSGEDHHGAGADYYVQIKNNLVSGPYIIGNINESEVGIATSGGLVYLAGTTGGAGHTKVPSQMVTLGVLDPKSFAAVTTLPDTWGVSAAIDPGSLLLPFSGVYQHTDVTKGGSVTVLPSGALAVSFKTHRVADICVGVFAPTGKSLGTPVCATVGAGREPNTRPQPVVLPNNRLGYVFNGSSSDTAVRFFTLSLDGFNLTNVPMLPVNSAPVITSTPALTGAVGVPYSYTGVATDAETPAAMLTWATVTAPLGFSITAAGVASWTPTVSQTGPQPVVIHVCDTGAPPRCTEQSFFVTVSSPQAPIITSVPSTTALVGKAYSYQVVATDADAAISGYAVVAPSPAPGNMNVSGTGLFTWTPTPADIGAVSIQLKVTDTAMLSATQSFTLTVVPVGAGPMFVSIPSTVAVEGTAYTYQAVAVDPGNAAAAFTYSLSSTPSGDLAMDPSGALTWKPTGKEHGTVTIALLATEAGGATATQTFSVNVLSPNVEAGSSGCGCVVGGTERTGTPLAALLLLAGALWLGVRRRRRA